MSRCTRIAVAVSAISLLVDPGLVWAGGLHIHRDSVALEGQQPPASFQPGQLVSMTFDYELYAYSGKPNVFGLFRIQNLTTKREETLFATQIHHTQSRSRARALFRAPDRNGKYLIETQLVPIFTNRPLSTAELLGEMGPGRRKKIEQFYRRNYAGRTKVALFEVRGETGGAHDPGASGRIMLQGARRTRRALNEGKPPAFAWTFLAPTSGKTESIEFTHRLSPVEDWKPWSEIQAASYEYLRPAGYRFEVKARYHHEGTAKETRAAVFAFELSKEIFVPSKGFKVRPRAPASSTFLGKRHYPKSRALLVGVEKSKDPAFPALSFVNNDIALMEGVLTKSGFEVEKLTADVSSSKLRAGLTDFLAGSSYDERVVIYYSGHGTSKGEAGFLVTADCERSSLAETCFALSELRQSVLAAYRSTKLKHLLVLLDSCQAGLGVLSKSDQSTPVDQLLGHAGAHVFSAGLPNEEAFATGASGTSIFTRFVAAGLEGAADTYPRDRVITLAELHVYVQNQVSREAANYERKQTPVMGRIAGAGEMLFVKAQSE